MSDRFLTIIAGLAVGGALFLGARLTTAAGDFSSVGRYSFIGATPRGRKSVV